MRHLSAVTAALLSVTVLGCMSEKKNPLEGTWRLVAGTSKTADTTVDYTQMRYKGLKMFCDNHFMFVGHSFDTVDNYGGGSYTLDGNTYTEVVMYHAYRALVGDTISFDVQVNNDTLVQKGPRKIGKYRDAKWELTEVYHRVR
jgi:hypothetical protein